MASGFGKYMYLETAEVLRGYIALNPQTGFSVILHQVICYPWRIRNDTAVVWG